MASVHMSKETRSNHGGPPGRTKGKGAAIMKTVSILLVNSRRVCNQRKCQRDKSDGKTTRRRIGSKKMDESAGKLNTKLLESLKKRTHFSKKELMALFRIYKKLITNCPGPSKMLSNMNSSSVIAQPHATIEGIDRNVFRELMHSTFDIATEETLMERIFSSWEKGNEGLPLRLEGWIIGLSAFLRGTMAEKASFCFRVYDLNNDGFITKDEMFTLLKNSLIKQPQDEDPDESVKDLVEIALRKFDVDKDGKISYQDFFTTIKDEPLLLEALGQCLPSESAVSSFLSTFQN